MMKKLFIAMTLFILSFTFISQTVHADAVLISDPGVNSGGLWHVEEGNRIYVHMRYTIGSTPIETGNFPAGVSDSLILADPYANDFSEYDYTHYTYFPSSQASDFAFPNSDDLNQAILSNPDPSVYTTFKVEIISKMTDEERDLTDPPTYMEIASYNTAINEIDMDLFNKSQMNYCDLEFSFMNLNVDDVQVLSSRQLTEGGAAYCTEQLPEYGPYAMPLPEANPNYDDLSFGVRMYWEKDTTSSTVIDPGNDVTSWNELPETTGSPTTPSGDWGTVDNINFSGQQVSFDITYQGVTHEISEFTVFGDLDFMENDHDVQYYTDSITGDRILYFNFGHTEASRILNAQSITDVDDWEGEALWNLTENEIKVTDKMDVYNYIQEPDEDGNIYSYFYMPDVPMDDLISVSAVLAYQYWDDGFLGWGDLEPGDVQYKPVTAVRGETTSVNPSWVENQYKNSLAAASVTTIVMIAGSSIIPGVGWVVPMAFFAAGGSLALANSQEWFAYDVEQIEHVIPSIALANEINYYIEEASGNHSFNVDTDRLYKLHLATLDTSHDDIQIERNLSNITQVVWETEGEIYVVDEEFINDTWVGPGLEPPAEDGGNSDIMYMVYGAGGIAALYGLFRIKSAALRVVIVLAIGYLLWTNGIVSI